MSITLTKIKEEKMKLNSIAKIVALFILVIGVAALASCAEPSSNVTDDTTIDTTTVTEDVTVDVSDTTAPDETTAEPEDTEPEPEDTTAKETEPARDPIDPIVPWEDESETPDEVITGEELKALVESADEAWGWLWVYNIFLDKDADPFIYRETEYYPVADYKTLDEFRERLLECFSVSLVNRIISGAFYGETPLFIVENGVLMAREHVRLTDVDMLISAKYYANRTGERKAYFVRPVQVRETNNGIPSVSRKEHTYNMVFEYGKWVFSSYSDYYIYHYPQND